ncbi:hypothetical protein IH575_00155 [Candidatus Dojkabacteria bacterium]|nr:hypothetical protein [Candidatus Dojkabacteria bacterium]
MNFFKKLFGNKPTKNESNEIDEKPSIQNEKENSTESDIKDEKKQEELEGLVDVFTNVLKKHLNRVIDLLESYQSSIDYYFNNEMLKQISEIAISKMELSLIDGEEHSSMISNNGAAYYINTFPFQVEDAPHYFTQKYGGYSELLAKILNSYQFKNPGNKILFHIIYLVDDGMSSVQVHMSIIPINLEELPTQILATDMLNSTERYMSGL